MNKTTAWNAQIRTRAEQRTLRHPYMLVPSYVCRVSVCDGRPADASSEMRHLNWERERKIEWMITKAGVRVVIKRKKSRENRKCTTFWDSVWRCSCTYT